MAKELKNFPWETKARGNKKHPWSQWANGKPWQLTKGVDFKAGDRLLEIVDWAAQNYDPKGWSGP